VGPDITGEIGGSPGDSDPALGALIAFFIALQSISREKASGGNQIY
jgi:hypothetical protein